MVLFNAKKTQLLTVSRKKIRTASTDIVFSNEHIKKVDFIKLLGLNITSNLDWSYHIDKLVKHAG